MALWEGALRKQVKKVIFPHALWRAQSFSSENAQEMERQARGWELPKEVWYGLKVLPVLRASTRSKMPLPSLGAQVCTCTAPCKGFSGGWIFPTAIKETQLGGDFQEGKRGAIKTNVWEVLQSDKEATMVNQSLRRKDMKGHTSINLSKLIKSWWGL